MAQAVVHFEVPGNDPEVLTRFYEQAFGWKTTDMPDVSDTRVQTPFYVQCGDVARLLLAL